MHKNLYYLFSTKLFEKRRKKIMRSTLTLVTIDLFTGGGGQRIAGGGTCYTCMSKYVFKYMYVHRLLPTHLSFRPMPATAYGLSL